MKLYTTRIRAINPLNGEMAVFSGPYVPGISLEDARNYCQENGLGYCEVDGELICEIPALGKFQADWANKIDHYTHGLN